MKKTVVGFASVMLSALSFGAWYESPVLKAKVDQGDWSGGQNDSDPLYIGLSESGKFLFVGLDSWLDLYPSKLFRSADLAAANGEAEDCSFKTAEPVKGQGWKGGAISEKWGVAITGSGNTTAHTVMALSGDESAALTLGYKSDGIDFDADGNLFGNNGDARSQIVRYSFSALSAKGGTVSATKTFDTSLARVRNLSVYTIGGKTLAFCGEGDSSKATKGKVIAVDVDDKEYELVTTALTADIMNVKVSGIAAGEPKLYVMSEAGELAVYQLAADGLSVASATPVKTMSAADFNALFGATVSGEGFRSFEVTDDGSRAFLVAGQRYSDATTTYLYVLRQNCKAVSPLAHWDFEDASDLGKDSMDYDNLTVKGTTTDVAPKSIADGHVGKALRMQRTTGTIGPAYLGVCGKLPSGNDAFTVSAWIRPDSASTKTAYLVSNLSIGGGIPGSWTYASGATGAWAGWSIRFADDKKLSVFFNAWKDGKTATDSLVLQLAVPSGVYNDGKWHHVVLRHTAQGVNTLFFDGTKSADKTIEAKTNAGASFLLGSYEKGNGFSGDYDEVKVYDCALSDEGIRAEYDGFKSDSDGNALIDAEEDESIANTLTSTTMAKLIKTGAGTASLTVASPNFTGAAEVLSGTLRTAVANVFPSLAAIRIAAGSVFEFGGNATSSAPVSGDGTLRFSGLGKMAYNGSGSAFAGTYQLYAANVDMDIGTASRASLDVAGGGAFSFADDAAVGSVSGTALLGGIRVAADKTLAVNDGADTSYAGRLGGEGTLAKNGPGTLTVTGSSDVREIDVNAGTLALDRQFPFDVKGLIGYWRFEDGDSLGRDSTGNSDFALVTTSDGTVTVQVDDGSVAKAVRMRKSASSVANAMLSPADALPSGKNPFTAAAWVRANSDSAIRAYLLVNRTCAGGKPGSWTGASWNGWNMRYYDGKLAAGYVKEWADPNSKPDWFVTGSLPNANVYKDGRWHHVAVTRTTDLVTAIYFDGVKLAEKAIASHQDMNSGMSLAIGAQDSGNSFSGDYDEVMAFSRALSEAEIADLYRYRRPEEDDDLPVADAHWTFDEIAEADGKKLFKDVGANHLDFKNVPTGSDYVECVTGEGINGGAAYVRKQGSYLQLDDGLSAAGLLMQESWPNFTISIRVKNVSCTGLSRNPFLCFGNGKQAEKCLRLSFEGVVDNPATAPQIMRVFPGSPSGIGGAGYPITDTLSSADADSPWTTITLVNDVNTNRMKIYRDGAQVDEVSTAGTYQGTAKTAFNFDLSRIDIGYNTYNKFSGFMVDDLRVYRKTVFSDSQVRRLVLEQAGVKAGSSLSGSTVKLAAGAKLDVKGGDHVAGAVAGAGTVNISVDGAFGAYDWSGFAGSVTGLGQLALYSKLPSGLSVETKDMVVAGAVTDRAGSGLPVATGAGSLTIAKTGVFRFTDAATAKDIPAGRFIIATAESFIAPEDFSGWTLEPSDVDTRYAFKVVNGRFQLNIKGGTAIIIR